MILRVVLQAVAARRWDKKQREQDIKLVIKRDKDDRDNQLIELASIKSSDYSSYILKEAKKKFI